MSKEINTRPTNIKPELPQMETRVVSPEERTLIERATYSGGSVPPTMVEHLLPPPKRK